MEGTFIQYKKRHKASSNELRKIALPVIDRLGVNKACEMVSKNLNVTGQTVSNYVYGRCKDGYLTEAIMEEFKKLSL